MSAKNATTQVLAAGSISATGQVGQPWPTETQNEGELYVAFTAAGTTITLAIEISPDGGTTWFTHTTLAAITATGNVLTKLAGNLGKLMRLNATACTGTFTGSIWFNGKRVEG